MGVKIKSKVEKAMVEVWSVLKNVLWEATLMLTFIYRKCCVEE
jgi:hypothetical protein